MPLLRDGFADFSLGFEIVSYQNNTYLIRGSSETKAHKTVNPGKYLCFQTHK
jgi:hypothetical protein